MDDHKCNTFNRNNYLFDKYRFKCIIDSFFISLFYIFFYGFSKNILNLQGLRSEQSNKGRFKLLWNHLKELKIKIYSAENYFLKRFNKNSKLFANTRAFYSTLVASPKYLLEMMVFIALSSSVLLLVFKNQISSASIPLLEHLLSLHIELNPL